MSLDLLLTILAILFFLVLIGTIIIAMRGRDAARRLEHPEEDDRV